ncbi:hypothetical protein ABPG74_004373 [Tetrahymena malaccensis]
MQNQKLEEKEEEAKEQLSQQLVQEPDLQLSNQDIPQIIQEVKQVSPLKQGIDIETSKPENQKSEMNDEQTSQFQSEQQKNLNIQKDQMTNSECEKDSQKIQNDASLSQNQPQNTSKNEQMNGGEIEDEQKIYNMVSSKCTKKEYKKYANVLFYAGAEKSNFGKSESIKQIHSRYKNYKILEYDHAYIQWIFPNKYQSSFNSSSQALSDNEIEIFLVEPLLAKRIVKSYEMMLDFYGMSIRNYITGELKRNENYDERYEEAVCGHNVLRIRRILTSLSNLGFRKYAIQLCKFLYKEIYEDDRPLKKNKGDYSYSWEMYQESRDKYDVKILEENCFQRIDQINRESVFFTSGLDKQMQEQLLENPNYSQEEIKVNKKKKNSA